MSSTSKTVFLPLPASTPFSSNPKNIFFFYLIPPLSPSRTVILGFWLINLFPKWSSSSERGLLLLLPSWDPYVHWRPLEAKRTPSHKNPLGSQWHIWYPTALAARTLRTCNNIITTYQGKEQANYVVASHNCWTATRPRTATKNVKRNGSPMINLQNIEHTTVEYLVSSSTIAFVSYDWYRVI